MDKSELYARILRSPNNVRFGELCALAEYAGFHFRRQKGSHQIFTNPNLVGLNGMMNFQEENGKAKPYQVRQLLNVIEKYELI
jgi:hypothetical protein